MTGRDLDSMYITVVVAIVLVEGGDDDHDGDCILLFLVSPKACLNGRDSCMAHLIKNRSVCVCVCKCKCSCKAFALCHSVHGLVGGREYVL